MSDAPYKHARIADVLRQRIHDGTHPPGQRLPSIPELRRTFAIGDRTARAALQTLISEGLAIAHRRRGTYVAGGTSTDTPPSQPRPRRTHAARRHRPADAPTPGDDDLTTHPTSTTHAPPPPDVALALDIDPRSPTLQHQSVLSDAHGVIAVRTIYGTTENGGPIITHTYARHPTPDEAHALEIPAAGIVLVHDETAFTTTAEPRAVTRTSYRADTVRLADQYQPRT